MAGEGMSEGGKGGGGGAKQPGNDRRAWVLVEAQDPGAAAEALMDYAIGDNYVLVRADEVETENSGINVIVPVVADNRAGLGKALDFIRTVPGVTNATEARVTWHRPPPDQGNEDDILGNNAWG